MSALPMRVFDTSALIALFEGHEVVTHLYNGTAAGKWQVHLPAVAIAEAEWAVRAGESGWAGILLTANIHSVPLEQSAAVEIGSWMGTLATRHTVYEARTLRAVVITVDPHVYEGHEVPLLVV